MSGLEVPQQKCGLVPADLKKTDSCFTSKMDLLEDSRRIAIQDNQAIAKTYESPINKGEECYFIEKRKSGGVVLNERPWEKSGGSFLLAELLDKKENFLLLE